MLDTIASFSGYIYAATLAGAFVYALAVYVRRRNTIPQSEIDAEARRLIVEYGEGAVAAAEGQVQRAQWAKGKSATPERAKRVLRAVRELVG